MEFGSSPRMFPLWRVLGRILRWVLGSILERILPWRVLERILGWIIESILRGIRLRKLLGRTLQ